MRTERAFYKKTKSNSIIKLVREQYLRTDIPCLSKACPSHCNNEGPHGLLSATANHYIIPDNSVIMRYLEILEQEEITGIILSQTVTINKLFICVYSDWGVKSLHASFLDIERDNVTS
ncbi:hypothetical protein INT48_008031 [Thamnidium elegans]|uniref:Uncharacterized protein n=1 Tax=Thamnidium elegans TaxID=101142 RepID=A0A8H7SR60_9FUNG|nr:hypothetical protein INT48_008031 [Thamnidium elegans]